MKINPNKKKICKNDFIEKSSDSESDSESCQEQRIHKKMRIKKLEIKQLTISKKKKYKFIVDNDGNVYISGKLILNNGLIFKNCCKEIDCNTDFIGSTGPKGDTGIT
jgi:hypothetical protein